MRYIPYRYSSPVLVLSSGFTGPFGRQTEALLPGARTNRCASPQSSIFETAGS